MMNKTQKQRPQNNPTSQNFHVPLIHNLSTGTPGTGILTAGSMNRK